MKYLIFTLLIFFIVSCKTVKIDIHSDPCSDTQVFIDLSGKMKGFIKKDGSSVTRTLTWVENAYSKCLEYRKQIRKDKIRTNCIMIVYGLQLLPKKDNHKKYADFMDCIK